MGVCQANRIAILWKGQSTFFLALFRRRILGPYLVAPCSAGPFVLLLMGAQGGAGRVASQEPKDPPVLK